MLILIGTSQFPDANCETLKQWVYSIDYESRAIIQYHTRHNVPIIYCDSPQELEKVDFDSEARKSDSSLIKSMETFLRLSPEDARRDLAKEYSQSEYPVNDCKKLVDFYQARDEYTEKILRREIKRCSGNFVYVCGLDHIFGDYHPNLFDRISDLNPRRMKLSEAYQL